MTYPLEGKGNDYPRMSEIADSAVIEEAEFETARVKARNVGRERHSMSDDREMDLKIVYTGGLNVELDKAIEKCLEKFNLKRWASGMDLVTGERDMAFDDKKR